MQEPERHVPSGTLQRPDLLPLPSTSVRLPSPARPSAQPVVVAEHPTLGAMLYPDLVQRFLPVALPGMDRAQALERAWESRWNHVMHDTWLGSSYESMTHPDPASDMPLLLLNTTGVEDGKRALVEEQHGRCAGEEADDQPAQEPGSRRIVMHGMSVHVRWTRIAPVQFITAA